LKLFLLFQGDVIRFAVDIDNVVRISQETEIENGFASRGNPYVAEDSELRISFFVCLLAGNMSG